jgi:O-antigen ligase
VLAALFFALYRPLILVRGGNSDEQTEQISTGERIILTEAAFTAIQCNPLLGVGAGNFPWFASYYFYFETEIDHRGDNVHSVLLTVQAELGLVGTALFGAVVIGAFWILRCNSDVDQRFMIGIFVALLVIGQFDHYPWTLFAYKVFWLALLGFALQSAQPKLPPESEVLKMDA